MDHFPSIDDFGIASRLTRSRGRTPRDQNANARLTRDELQQLKDAAKEEGKALGEWTREVLLREAGRGSTDRAVFTELMAVRLLLHGVLREIAVGRPMTPEAFAQVVAEVRTAKHDTARDVLAQYGKRNEGR